MPEVSLASENPALKETKKSVPCLGLHIFNLVIYFQIDISSIHLCYVAQFLSNTS